MAFQKKYLLITLILLLIFSLFFYICYYRPFPLKKYSYRVPNNELIVGIEPYGTPEFIVSKVLKEAFPEYKIVYSNDIAPHLIVRIVSGEKYKPKWDAPYIVWSGERYGTRNRRNGPPIAELVSFKPKNSKQFYFPFIINSKINLENIREFNNLERNKFSAYINSNCIKIREDFFAKLYSYNNKAEALGKCSNTNSGSISSKWADNPSIYKDYRFGFAMENASVPGYITEKILNVYKGGAIPIYWGDNKIVTELFNPKSFINLNNFKNFDQAIKYIDYLEKNPHLLEQMYKEPVFRNNVVPEIFKLHEEKANKYVTDCAEHIRKEFFKIIM